jgi:hypothetical protein
MGPSGNVLTADSQTAIMFVEVYYQYSPIFFRIGGSTGPVIYRAAAMYVRDDRNLSGTGIDNTQSPVTVSSC